MRKLSRRADDSSRALEIHQLNMSEIRVEWPVGIGHKTCEVKQFLTCCRLWKFIHPLGKMFDYPMTFNRQTDDVQSINWGNDRGNSPEVGSTARAVIPRAHLYPGTGGEISPPPSSCHTSCELVIAQNEDGGIPLLSLLPRMSHKILTTSLIIAICQSESLCLFSLLGLIFAD